MPNKIPAKAVIRALDSTAFLNWQFGLTFNGMITLNFEDLGATTETAATKVITRLNSAIADKLARFRGGWRVEIPYCYLYVHEDVRTSFGHHVHQLVVMPRGLGEFLDTWLKEWARREYACTNPKAVQYDADYPKSVSTCVELQSRMVRYILKSSANAAVMGMDGKPTTLHSVLEAERHTRAYCAPVRKVIGSSQNLTKKAQLHECFSLPNPVGQVFTDEHLRCWEGYQRSRELHRQLAAIQC